MAERMDGHRATRAWPVLPLLLSAVTLFVGGGCAASANSSAPPTTADSASAPGACGDGLATSSGPIVDETLPRYFSLELSGNQAHVDGAPLSGSNLSRRIEQEAQSAANDGAVVRVRDEASGEVLGALVWELSSAGFEHIIISQGLTSGQLPAAESPAASSGSAKSLTTENAALPGVATNSELEPAQAPASEAVSNVKVRSIGLHVGGGPNDDATKAKFIGPIEQRFDALARCHALAPNGDRNASLGVDLLIDTRGGRATLKELRTALSGKDFEQCVRAAFDQVVFPAITRPTVVSYSMLFEPGPR